MRKWYIPIQIEREGNGFLFSARGYDGGTITWAWERSPSKGERALMATVLTVFGVMEEHGLAWRESLCKKEPLGMGYITITEKELEAHGLTHDDKRLQ